MSKGPTKAQQALTEAREWIEASKEEVKEREAALVEAQGQLMMHETIYAILEKTLTRQSSAKSTTKKSSKKSSKGGSKSLRASSLQQQLKATASRTITGPACSVCGNMEDHPDHDTAHYLSAHEFNTGKPATLSTSVD